MQQLLEAGIRSKWKDDVEKKIDETLDEMDRGDVTPWRKGDCEWVESTCKKYERAKRDRDAGRSHFVLLAKSMLG